MPRQYWRRSFATGLGTDASPPAPIATRRCPMRGRSGRPTPPDDLTEGYAADGATRQRLQPAPTIVRGIRGSETSDSRPTSLVCAAQTHGQIGRHHRERQMLVHVIAATHRRHLEVPAQHRKDRADLKQGEVASGTQPRPGPEWNEGTAIVGDASLLGWDQPAVGIEPGPPLDAGRETGNGLPIGENRRFPKIHTILLVLHTNMSLIGVYKASARSRPRPCMQMHSRGRHPETEHDPASTPPLVATRPGKPRAPPSTATGPVPTEAGVPLRCSRRVHRGVRPPLHGE